MTLSPSDVEQKTFSTALRGYDLDEVDDFLDEVVATIRELNEELDERPTASPVPGETAIVGSRAEPGQDETAVGRALVAAQETADRIVAEAREKAEQILAQARQEAESLTSERDQRKAKAEAEMEELSQLVAGVRSQLAVLAGAVEDRLDEMDSAIDQVPEIDGGEATDTGATDNGSDGETDLEEFTLDEDGEGLGSPDPDATEYTEQAGESEASEEPEQGDRVDEKEASERSW